MKAVPKNFRCRNCRNETYNTYDECKKCGTGHSIFPIMSRNEPSKTIKERINKLLDQQNAKGLAEYGISLDDVDVNRYDWKNETIMELIDALQYSTKEIVRLEEEIKKLQEGKHDNN